MPRAMAWDDDEACLSCVGVRACWCLRDCVLLSIVCARLRVFSLWVVSDSVTDGLIACRRCLVVVCVMLALLVLSSLLFVCHSCARGPGGRNTTTTSTTDTDTTTTTTATSLEIQRTGWAANDV